MKQFTFCLLFTFLAITSSFGQSVPSLKAYVDSLFQASIKEGFIAGGAVIVKQGDQRLVDESYGFASVELSTPMPTNASFEIGSVTKQFTAAAILKLVEMGKLSLADDFTKYLAFDTKGRKVTVEQLLNHTSGIPSYTEIPEFWPLSLHQYSRDTLVRIVEQHPFLFEPGEAMIYNNSGYFFLGLIIEQVSGQSYEDFLAEHLFKPLGMENTYYCSSSKVVKNKAYGYRYSPDGLRQKPYLDHAWPYAAGSLCSSASDLLKWMEGIHRENFLGKSNYESLIKPASLSDGTLLQYAKGIMNHDYYGHQMIAHGGGIHGFLSETRYFPEESLYIICLINTTGPRGAGFFANNITWKLLSKKQPATEAIDFDLSQIAGKYEGPIRGRTLSLEVKAMEDGLIIIDQEDPEPDTLNHYLGNQTFLLEGRDQIIFTNEACRWDNGSGYYILKKQ